MISKKNIILIIEKIFPFYLASQVAIDLITTFFVHVLKFPISFGMLIRFGFIAIAILYILLKGKKSSKVLLALLVMVNVYQLLYLYKTVAQFNLFLNIKYYLRTSYYAFLMLFLWEYKGVMNKEKILNIINFNLILIILVFIISNITKTSFPMYAQTKIGSSGWFSSGNEISSIMSMLSIVSLYSFFKKENNFNFFILLGTVYVLAVMGTKTSLLSLILVLAISMVKLFYNVIIKHKYYIHFIIFVPIIVFLIYNYDILPAMKNVNRIGEIQSEMSYKSKITEHTEIPEEIKENRYKIPAKDINDFIGSVTLKVTKNTNNDLILGISGYFYPKYFDVSYPAYIEKSLRLYNEKNSIIIPLSDVYNRHVSELIDQDYNGDFSGLSGSIHLNQTKIGTDKYKISMIIKIDGLEKEYDIINSIYFAQSEQIIIKDHNQIYFDLETANKMETPKSSTAENSSTLKKVPYIPWLSGRLERLNQFGNLSFKYRIYNFIFGTGYVKNYIDANGLEMDIVEVFITYGLLGFIIYFSVTIMCGFTILKKIIKNLKKMFKNNDILLLISVLIGLGLALVVGHTILTPASAIYLGVLLIILCEKYEEGENEGYN